MYVITVEFRLREEHRERFMQRMRQQAKDSLEKESGCQQFDVAVHSEDPCRVFLYELYDDEAAFQAHLQSAHFKDFDRTTAGWFEDKQVQAWQRLD